LFAFPGVEVAGGDLEGVEDESGSAVVYGFGGEADGDLGEGGLDGLAVAGAGELELVAGNDGGRGVHAVLVAEVFVVHGVAAAAAVLAGPVHALVRDEWILFHSVEVLHGVPPGCMKRQSIENTDGCGWVWLIDHTFAG
jgi:hypothetical protein